MSIADFDVNSFDTTQQQQEDQKLLVKFYVKAVKDQGASKREGRPIFKETEYVDIRIPGSRDGAARPATHKDKERFHRHYQAFKNRIELPAEGTPLTEWAAIGRSLAEEMAFFNIKTVEQLADMNDNIAGQFMGAQKYKQQAKAWLEHSKRDVTIDELTKELKQRDKLLADMQKQIDKLSKAQEE